jgi:hypothetical protein
MHTGMGFVGAGPMGPMGGPPPLGMPPVMPGGGPGEGMLAMMPPLMQMQGPPDAKRQRMGGGSGGEGGGLGGELDELLGKRSIMQKAKEEK